MRPASCLAAISALLIAGWAAEARQQAPKRLAVLIGINEYKHPKLPPLKYAEADVQALADILGASGYQVRLLIGSSTDGDMIPTKANIDRHLLEAMQGCEKEDLVLVAFAGHGVQFDGKGDAYFCPIDGRPFKDQARTLISLGEVYRGFEASFAGMKVLLVDACRNDPEAGAGRDARGINADQAPHPPQGVAALFSCRAGQKAFEHESLGHGVFFHRILEGMQGKAKDGEGKITFAILASYVAQSVPADVRSLIGPQIRQSPNLRADYSDEPILIPAKPIAAGGVSNLPLATTPAMAVIGDVTTAPSPIPGEFPRSDDDSPAPETFVPFTPSRPVIIGDAVKGTPVTVAADAPVAAAVKGDDTTATPGEFPRSDKNPPAVKLLSALDFEYFEFRTIVDLRRREEYISKHGSERADAWLAAAKAGDSRGQLLYGCCALRGAGVKQNTPVGILWLKQAAAKGEGNAACILGNCYQYGAGVQGDPAEAYRWYSRGAELKNPKSAYCLARCCELGIGTPKDGPAAVQWYKRSAELGDRAAMRSLAFCYETGWNVQKDMGASLVWYTRAAELGEEQAMLWLGEYNMSRLLTRTARGWFEKAAALGNATAAERLKAVDHAPTIE